MKDASGICNGNLFNMTTFKSRFAVFTASYGMRLIFLQVILVNVKTNVNIISIRLARINQITHIMISLDNGWLFAHETGHCLYGQHLKAKGKHN